MTGQPCGCLAMYKQMLARATPGDPDSCWEWPHARTERGYGRHGGGYTHRYALCAQTGAHPQQSVCHRCDNPSCWNPDHLFPGSQSDNLKDASQKGRLRARVQRGTYRGESNGFHRFTEEDIREIRRLRSETELTQREIGEMFGTSQSVVSAIILRKAWPHVI